jgi:hypothetical protein
VASAFGGQRSIQLSYGCAGQANTCVRALSKARTTAPAAMWELVYFLACCCPRKAWAWPLHGLFFDFFHLLEFAKAAASAFAETSAEGLEYMNDIDRAKLAGTQLIGKTLFEAEAWA